MECFVEVCLFPTVKTRAGVAVVAVTHSGRTVPAARNRHCAELVQTVGLIAFVLCTTSHGSLDTPASFEINKNIFISLQTYQYRVTI